MPAYQGTLSVNQSMIFYSQSGPALGVSAQIPVNFPGTGGTIQLTAGAGANQYAHLYASTATYGTGGTALNLTNTLTQPDGTLATFADVTGIMVSCPSTNTDYISVGAGTDPLAWLTNAIKVYPGMTLVMAYPVATGLAVTTTTADRINVVANSGTQTASVMIIGH
jgi:hypothetical protein